MIDILQKEITSPEGVVYLLVEIVKLTEADNSKNKYKMITLFRNWVAHPKLEWDSTAMKLIKNLEGTVKPNSNGKDVARGFIEKAPEFFKLSTLKNELRNFLHEHDLPNDFIEDRNKWNKFVKILLGIIEESAIVLADKHSKIKTIQSLSLVKDKKGTPSYKFSLSIDIRPPVIKLKL